MDAIDNLSDAIDATRELLLPVDIWLWLKLSLVVLFVVGSGAGPSFSGGDVGSFADSPTIEEDVDIGTLLEELPEDALLFGAVAIGVVVFIQLLFGLIGGIAEFVFIESLRSREVHLRRYAGRNLGRGFRLFGFRLLTGMLVTAIVFGPLVYRYLTTDSFAAVADWVLWVILLAIPLYFLYAILMRFTSEFVAPVMLLEERGVLKSWGRFWGTLTTQWKEYVVYLLLAWIILAVIEVSLIFVFAIGGIVLAIPFVILTVIAFGLGDIGVVIGVFILLVAALLFILLYAVIWMPIRSYFQYYALLLLGDTNAELDLIPDQRREIRSGDSTPTASQREESDGPDTRRDSDEEADSAGSSWDEDRTDPWDDDQSSSWDEDRTDSDDDDRDDTNRGW